MVTETDKRKAGELRAQHDAHSLVISQMERDSRAQLVKLVSLVVGSLLMKIHDVPMFLRRASYLSVVITVVIKVNI